MVKQCVTQWIEKAGEKIFYGFKLMFLERIESIKFDFAKRFARDKHLILTGVAG